MRETGSRDAFALACRLAPVFKFVDEVGAEDRGLGRPL